MGSERTRGGTQGEQRPLGKASPSALTSYHTCHHTCFRTPGTASPPAGGVGVITTRADWGRSMRRPDPAPSLEGACSHPPSPR